MAFKGKAQRKFDKVMREFGKGELKSHGEKVTDQKQAVAIAFSEARKINPRYKAQDGMMLEGPSHEEGGIKGIVAGVQPIEMEGGEAIINKRSMKIREIIECKGTPEGVVSAINVLGDGIKLSDQPGVCHLKQEIMAREGKKTKYPKIRSIIESNKPKKIQRMRIKDNELVKAAKGAKISSKEARDYVANTQPFRGEGHIMAENVNGSYVVYSYGYYPILVYNNRQWYENSEKFSRTTSKQLSQSRPLGIDTIKKTTSELEEIIGEKRTAQSHWYGYGGKTPEQVWNYWNEQERQHFLYDHKEELPEEVITATESNLKNKSYGNLPEAVRQSIKGHIMMGQYDNGGMIQEYGSFIKVNEPGNFKIIEALSGSDFRKDKIVYHNELMVYGFSPELQSFLENYGIHYSEIENETELRHFLYGELPQRMRSKDSVKNLM